MSVNLSTTSFPVPAISMTRRWIGRVISALMTLFMFVDGITKALQIAPVVEASAQLGLSASATLAVGVLALVCLAIYLIPRTAPLGAILLTGYLGGAVATQVRAGAPAFSLLFPLIRGALLWLGLYLRDARLRALLS
jgi:hypothetical protein